MTTAYLTDELMLAMLRAAKKREEVELKDFFDRMKAVRDTYVQSHSLKVGPKPFASAIPTELMTALAIEVDSDNLSDCPDVEQIIRTMRIAEAKYCVSHFAHGYLLPEGVIGLQYLIYTTPDVEEVASNHIDRLSRLGDRSTPAHKGAEICAETSAAGLYVNSDDFYDQDGQCTRVMRYIPEGELRSESLQKQLQIADIILRNTGALPFVAHTFEFASDPAFCEIAFGFWGEDDYVIPILPCERLVFETATENRYSFAQAATYFCLPQVHSEEIVYAWTGAEFCLVSGDIAQD